MENDNKNTLIEFIKQTVDKFGVERETRDGKHVNELLCASGDNYTVLCYEGEYFVRDYGGFYKHLKCGSFSESELEGIVSNLDALYYK